MADFVKSIGNIPDSFQGIYNPQTVFAETGEDRYRLHRTYTADELRCCDEGEPAPDDTTPPTVTGRTPLPDAFGVATDSDIVIDLDEASTLVDGIDIEIRRQSDNVAIKSFDFFSPDALYENASTRIRLTNIPFAAGTSYYVFVPSGAITDIAGNAFPGYGVNQWAFTTA